MPAHRSILLALLLVCGACRDAPTPASATLTVFAASSLREAFPALARRFEARHPGLTVTFNFAGSQELRTQLEQGARADVFASADARHMDAVVQAGLAEPPQLFARNEPVLVTPSRGPRLVGLADLPSASRIVLGAPEVPIGRYTQQILDLAGARLGSDFRARVEAHVVSREPNVRQVLAKVALGEADAAIVYRTDARASQGQVAVVDIPRNLNVLAAYPIAALRAAPLLALARAWVEFVRSPEGQAELAHAGFLPAFERSASP